MPDTPIKHSDIIKPGNPFDDTIRGLEKMIQLLKVAAKEYKKFALKQNPALKEGRKNIQAVAKATNELSSKERDAIKIKKQLRREREKLRSMDTPEFRALVKTKDAVNAKAAAMRKAAKVMRTGTKTTNKWSKALGSFAFKFNALGNIAANVASKITQSISRAVRGAVDIVIDFDQAMADTKAITGATGKEFDKLSKSAKNLGGVTKFTASEVAKLQKEYAKLGFSTEQILGAQAATLDLAAATNAELARSAEVVGITIKQFGLHAKEARRVTDVMSKSFATSALDMEKFANAMKFVGPAAKVSGLSIERTTAMLAQLADAGIAGTMAGSALRTIMLKLAKESGTLTEKITRLSEKGLDLAGASDEVQRRAATALLVLADGVDTIDEYTEALENAAGATADMANIQLNTIGGQLTLVKSAWEGMVLAILSTDSALEGVKWALSGVIDILNAMAIKFDENLSFAQAFQIAKTTRETAQWAIEMDRASRSVDDLVAGFGKIGGWMKNLGKDLWEQLFPKESGDNTVKTLEDITELVKKLKDETRFTEEDQEAILPSTVLEDEKNKLLAAAKERLGARQALELEAMQKEQAARDAARKVEEQAATAAEKLKQDKITATFDLANRLTSSFTSFFEGQKNKELATFESKQERQLAAVAGNAEATKRVTEKLAEERAEIEKKFAKKQQILAISQAVIDGAAAVVKTWRNMGGFPTALPFALAQGAIVAAQIGIIASQKFGEGEVDIHGPSHSRGGINAEIEGGESVINKRSTAKHRNLLEAINANDSASIANAALQNEAFHEVWGRTRMNNVSMVNNFDPNIKRMREIMEETPVIIPDGPHTERAPNGKTRVING